jgi:hypothetical protein
MTDFITQNLVMFARGKAAEFVRGAGERVNTDG